MIYDILENLGRYRGLGANMDRAIDFILAADFAAMPADRFEIDGTNVYGFIQEPALRTPEEAQFEAHRRYADIQIALQDGEAINYLPLDRVEKWLAYDDEKDILFSDVAEKGVAVPMKAGDFMILFPQDAHMPCLQAGAETTRKAVIKVKV